MPFIRDREIRRQIALEGATKTAQHFVEAIEDGHLTYRDFGIRSLWDNFMVDKRDDKTPMGHALIEEKLSEEAGTYTSSDAFSTITSQIFFNALTTYYNAADFTVAPTFKVIPSTLFRGEKFGGIANINTLLAPVGEGRELPHLEPTEDFSESPAQQRTGAIVDVTVQMIRGDRTGEVMNLFEKLGECAGVNREMEACSILAGDNNSYVPRNNYKWKGESFQTYQTSISGDVDWVNVVASNGLVDAANVNKVWTALQAITDPFTGLPIVTPPGRWKIFCTPDFYWNALRIKHMGMIRQINLQAGGNSEADYSPFGAGSQLPVDFDIVQSKYLRQVLTNAGDFVSNWYMGVPEAAFSWQRAMDVTMAEALPNAGHMFTRGLAASYKFEKYETSYVFNPRFIAKSTA